MTCKRLASAAARKDPAKRERILGYWRAYKKRKALDPEWRARRIETARASHVKRTYGITRDDYQALLDSQGGVCAICQKASKYRRRDGTLSGRFAIDHDHATGKVRGLLCDQCNRMIGHLDKDPMRAESAIAYWRRSL